MAFDTARDSVLLYGLERLLRLTARRHPEFAERLRQKDLVAHVRLRDGTRGRTFTFEGGAVRSCARLQLTGRIGPGTVHSYESCAVYNPAGEPGRSADRGGCINILTPSRLQIRKSHSIAAMSCLVEIRKARAEEVAPTKSVSLGVVPI